MVYKSCLSSYVIYFDKFWHYVRSDALIVFPALVVLCLPDFCFCSRLYYIQFENGSLLQDKDET